MLLIYQDRLYEFCFNIEYIILLINRVFLNQIIKKKDFYIDIKKILSIKIRELNIKKHNVCEYIIIFIYIFSESENGNVALIRREIHIINDLFIKTLIDINIIKFKTIVFDINKKFAIIKFYDFFQISIFMIIKNLKFDIVIVNKTRYVMLTYFFLIVFIRYIDFSFDRDLIFESKQLNVLIFSTYIVDHNLSRIVVRNDINLFIIFVKHVKLKKMLKYKTKECF